MRQRSRPQTNNNGTRKMKKKITPEYKTHLQSETDKDKPVCREFRRKRYKHIKLTNNIKEVTCETCKYVMEVRKRKKIVAHYDEHFKKHDKAEQTSKEYFLIRQEISNQYK